MLAAMLEQHSSVAYANDITLLCPSLSGMRKMLKVAKDYSDEFNIVFNVVGVGVVISGPATEKYSSQILDLSQNFGQLNCSDS